MYAKPSNAPGMLSNSVQNALLVSFATVSNGHRLIRLYTSSFVRFAPGAAALRRAVIGGANVLIQASSWSSEVDAAGQLSSRVSLP